MRNLWLGMALVCVACSPKPAPRVESSALVPLNPNQNGKVDLLFMVDNSNSMSAMQAELESTFFELFKPFDALAAGGQYVDFQIGVITSDYGAGSSGAPGCTTSPGGELGHLQALGAKAGQGCVAPVGANYIHYDNSPGGTNNLPPGQDLAATFTCMASGGDTGCGFEAQLESAYAALHDDIDNAGFIRPDAALAVVFLTNEDDASAPPDTDVFDKNLVATYGYEDSYSRQTRWAVMCCLPGMANCAEQQKDFPPYGDSGGALSGCEGASNPPGKEYDIQRYIDYFTLPSAMGGVKTNPADVLLYAIDAPATPFQVILSNPGTPAGAAYVPCATLNETSNPPCVPVLQHSCVNADDPSVFGDPAVRLNTVVSAVAQHQIWSICDEDYGGAMQQLGGLVVSQLGAACLPDAQFGTVDPSQVQCTVSQTTADVEGADVPIPQCSGAAVFPCWKLEQKSACATSFKLGYGLTIDRNGSQAPAGIVVNAACAPPQ